MVGAAQWQSGSAFDIPFADVERTKFDHSIQMAAIGYQYNIEELGTAMLVPGTNLTADKADAARQAYAQFMYGVAFEGNAEKGMDGLLNYTGVTATNAPAVGDLNGGTDSPYWIHKSSPQSSPTSTTSCRASIPARTPWRWRTPSCCRTAHCCILVHPTQ